MPRSSLSLAILIISSLADLGLGDDSISISVDASGEVDQVSSRNSMVRQDGLSDDVLHLLQYSHNAQQKTRTEIASNLVGGASTVSTKTGPATDVLHFDHVAISEGIIHVYGASSAASELEELHKYSTEPLPVGLRWNGVCHEKDCWIDDLPKMQIQFHDDLLDQGRDCAGGAIRNEIGFAFSRHLTHNMWHLHNDNILGMVNMIQNLPESFGCNRTTLKCEDGSTHLQKVLYDFEPSGGTSCAKGVVMEQVIDMLFDKSHPWDSIFQNENKPVCFRRFVWGNVRPKPFYKVSKNSGEFPSQSFNVNGARCWDTGWRQATQEAVVALNSYLRGALNMPSRPGPRGTKKIHAVYVPRTDPVRGLDEGSVKELLETCARHDWTCTACCDWGKETVKSLLSRFGDADVVMGAHGAGLAHVLYARPGAIVLDFGLEANWGQYFAMMADANLGSLVNGAVDKSTSPWSLVKTDQTLKWVSDLYSGYSSGDALPSEACTINEELKHEKSLADAATDPSESLDAAYDAGIEADINGV